MKRRVVIEFALMAVGDEVLDSVRAEVERQLGLKLELRKAMVDTLTIERGDSNPIPN